MDPYARFCGQTEAAASSDPIKCRLYEIASSHWDDESYPSLGSERETQDGWGAAGIDWSRDFHCLLGLGCPKQVFSENSGSPPTILS